MRDKALLTLALAALAAGAFGDIIVMNGELIIEGQIKEINEKELVLLVHQGEGKVGRVVIPRERVTSIEYDLSKRLEALEEDDHLGRYKLGEWAYRNGMIDEAITVLSGIVGKPDVPSKARLFLAKMLDGKGRFAEALEHYKSYRLANPDDQEAAARIAEIEGKLGPATAAGPKPPSAPEGLEVGSWRYERWGNPARVSVETNSQGNRMLRIVMDGSGSSDKVAISTRKRLDLSDRSKLSFAVHNATPRPQRVALALVTPSGYYEARPVTVKRDWNLSLSVDIASSKFKCKETNWDFQAKIPDLDKVQSILFLLYGGKQSGILYLDEVVFK